MAEQNLTGPAGAVTGNESFKQPMMVEGGSVKIIDPLTFPMAPETCRLRKSSSTPAPCARSTGTRPRTSRPSFIQGSGRITTGGSSHYIENTGTEDLVYLEVVKDHVHLPDELLDRLPTEKP
ncbi:hypothetical protein QBC32DRAFT_311740 [Pseudoneurospora amorphoporcata]|uniref:Uncharacterized protein n=1 Tax=Pseudoneurospora amorphoporcata TaxID=241081 RepID=A0AAN6P1H1_9PEZI|nr:hypothetical protein QBC32DRAFT_311740 [Pseudoneurospora amorphoporcata]